MTENIKIRKIEKSELELALNIYNSNKEFLIHHLGKECVDEEFLINEIDEMLAHGFTSNIVSIEDEPVGIIDYLLNDEGYVYLSLLMLARENQKKVLGKKVYSSFENMVRNYGANTIRIDVVDDYENNVIPFWKKMGFETKRHDELTWGDKKSKVSVMKKDLQSR